MADRREFMRYLIDNKVDINSNEYILSELYHFGVPGNGSIYEKIQREEYKLNYLKGNYPDHYDSFSTQIIRDCKIDQILE